jgi:hypothetical protein
VQDNIDAWKGKGELKIIEAHDINQKDNMFYEIISKKPIGTRSCWDGCCGFDDIYFYNIQFYEYEKHPLSIKCDEILNTNGEIEFSFLMRHFLEWEVETVEELQFKKQILQSMRFKKYDLK